MIVSTGSKVSTDNCFNRPIFRGHGFNFLTRTLVSLGQGVKAPLKYPFFKIYHYLALCVLLCKDTLS